VLRRPLAVAAVGLVIVAVFAGLGTQLNPTEAQLANIPGSGTAIAGRQMLTDAHISPGVMKPLDVLVEHGGNAQQIAAKLRAVPGVIGATAPRHGTAGPTRSSRPSPRSTAPLPASRRPSTAPTRL
jgi:uncharacterized membrane protein YdfJ with MMPL/SSD domain